MNTSYAKRLLTQSAWRQQQILLLPPPLTQLSLTEVIRWASNVRYDYLQTPWSQPHRQTCTDSATDTNYTTTTQHSHYYITFKHLDHSLADKLVLTLQQTPITLLQHITLTTTLPSNTLITASQTNLYWLCNRHQLHYYNTSLSLPLLTDQIHIITYVGPASQRSATLVMITALTLYSAKVCNVTFGNDYCINPLQCKGLQRSLW